MPLTQQKKCEQPQTKKTIVRIGLKTSLKGYPTFLGENKKILKPTFLF